MRRTIVGSILRSAVAIAAAAFASIVSAQKADTLTFGQLLYLPIYSHIYHGDQDKQGKPSQKLLSAHVSIRNTNSQAPLKVLYARYYDTDGKLVKEFVPSPLTIPPLGTHELFVPRSDVSGGSGANFLISWNAGAAVNPPLVEALHADIEPARTLTFITTARPILPNL
ncbi:MAG: DUF3124 domain-containing protein [Sterolibacterium sp.]